MVEVLGPDERREIDRLRRALALSEGPELHLIVGDTRRVVDAALAEVLPGMTIPHETVEPEEAPKAFALRWMMWLEQAIHMGGTQPLVLDAWDVDPEHIEHWGWIFGRLNERRNEIRRGLGRPLLLLVSPDNERLLGHIAPDLWSIRGVGMRLRDRGRVAVDQDIFKRRPSQPRPITPQPRDLAERLQRAGVARRFAPSIAEAIEALRLSQALHDDKRDEEALASVDVAIRHYEALARHDEHKRIDLARAYRMRAEILAAAEFSEAAIEDLECSASIAAELLRQDADRAEYLEDLRSSYVALGDIHVARGQEEQARHFYQRAQTIEERSNALDPRPTEAPPAAKDHSRERGAETVPGTRDAERDLAARIISELARVVHDSEQARLLALRAGFPPEQLPPFSNALDFWAQVVQFAAYGAITHGLEPLVREVVKLYPGNAALREYLSRLAAAGKHVPSTFISYSPDSKSHVSRVLALADRLRGEGIDVRLDQYVNSPLEGWSAWTKRQVAEVDFVIFVCTTNYCRRFQDEGSDTAEATLERHLFYETNDRRHGFLPVLLEGSTENDIPLPLRSYTFYTLPKDYDRLHRRITEQPFRPLGTSRGR